MSEIEKIDVIEGIFLRIVCIPKKLRTGTPSFFGLYCKNHGRCSGEFARNRIGEDTRLVREENLRPNVQEVF